MDVSALQATSILDELLLFVFVQIPGSLIYPLIIAMEDRFGYLGTALMLFGIVVIGSLCQEIECSATNSVLSVVVAYMASLGVWIDMMDYLFNGPGEGLLDVALIQGGLKQVFLN